MNFAEFASTQPQSKWKTRILMQAGSCSIKRISDGKSGRLIINFAKPDAAANKVMDFGTNNDQNIGG